MYYHMNIHIILHIETMTNNILLIIVVYIYIYSCCMLLLSICIRVNIEPRSLISLNMSRPFLMSRFILARGFRQHLCQANQ